MSTRNRIISGSASAWARILVTILAQILIVPICLKYWDIATYGIWLAAQALIVIVSTFDRGFNDYLQYEFLRIGTNDRVATRSLIWSSVRVSLIISCLETVILASLIFGFNLLSLVIEGPHLLSSKKEIIAVFFLQWGVWMMTSINGLLFRSLFAFGYFPRSSWWNVAISAGTMLFFLLSISNGAGLFSATLFSSIGVALLAVFQFIDIYFILKKERLGPIRSTLSKGFKSFSKSLSVSARYFLENFRQQGIRLFMTPYLGIVAMASFVTTRTVANVSLQGLSTVTNPLMPELMRFIQNKDQQRIDATFSSIWFVLIAFLAPAVIVLHCFGPELFSSWTHNKIGFDPILFGTLSTGVLIYALAQPATSIVLGNNMVNTQLVISILSMLCILMIIPLMNFGFGIGSVGFVLLFTEVMGLILFQKKAIKWLYENEIRWPTKLFTLSVISVVIVVFSMCFISLFQENKIAVLSISLVCILINLLIFLRSMPKIILERLSFFEKVRNLVIVNKA